MNRCPHCTHELPAKPVKQGVTCYRCADGLNQVETIHGKMVRYAWRLRKLNRQHMAQITWLYSQLVEVSK